MHKTLLFRSLHTLFAGAVLLACLALPGVSGQAQGQGVQQGKYFTEASALLIKLINQSNGQGYKMPDNTFSIGGGWLNQGTQNWVSLFTVELKAGTDYRFIAAADADATDLDLQVISPNGKVVAEDSGTEPDAIVNYRPGANGRYLIKLRLYASKDNLPCASLAVVMSK